MRDKRNFSYIKELLPYFVAFLIFVLVTVFIIVDPFNWTDYPCPECGFIFKTPVPNYCFQCGYNFRSVCPGCGKELPRNYGFCDDCGVPVGG